MEIKVGKMILWLGGVRAGIFSRVIRKGFTGKVTVKGFKDS